MKISVKNRRIVAIVALVALVGGLISFLLLIPAQVPPQDDDTEPTYPTDANGEQYATDSKGNVIPSSKDGEGNIILAGVEVLCDKGPLTLEKIEVENPLGDFEIKAQNDGVNATVYTIVGYENEELEETSVSALANDVTNMTTTKIIDINGEDIAEYGLDTPRIVATATFADGSTNKIIVGDEAPGQTGVYIMHNDDKGVYLVDLTSVDGLFYTPMQMIGLYVVPSAETDETAEPVKLTLSGTNFSQNVVIVENDDETVTAYYKMTSPSIRPVNTILGSSVMGSIRGLNAEEVVAVNPTNDELAEFGLSTPVATAKAEFEDLSVTLSASKEDENGNVYLQKDNVVYLLPSSRVPWATTSYEELKYEYIVNPNLEKLSGVNVTIDGKTYEFEATKSLNVDDDGNETIRLNGSYNGQELDTANLQTYLDNLTLVSREDKNVNDYSVSGSPVLKVEFLYNNGKSSDIIEYYHAEDKIYIAVLNGEKDAVLYEPYINNIIKNTPNLANNETVDAV